MVRLKDGEEKLSEKLQESSAVHEQFRHCCFKRFAGCKRHLSGFICEILALATRNTRNLARRVTFATKPKIGFRRNA
eukprot:6080185-Pleurochrysis_carterae.AAC.1